MRIRFLCVYFFWNSIVIAEQISRNLLLDHYGLQYYSAGVGFAKENRDNQTIFGWVYMGKEIYPKLGLNFKLNASSSKETQTQKFLNTEYIYNIKNKSEQIIAFSPGLKYNFISLYPTFHSTDVNLRGLSLGLNLYTEKSLFLVYRQNTKEQTRLFGVSVVSGRTPAIGLAVSKEYSQTQSEWSGSIGLSFQFESFQAGISNLPQDETDREENSFFVSRILQESRDSIFGDEVNPYGEVREFSKQEKNPSAEKKFVKKEKIIYEVKIEELLKFRIPLVVAIRISRASKSKEEYIELLKTLSPELVRKCNKIQFDKAKANR